MVHARIRLFGESRQILGAIGLLIVLTTIRVSPIHEDFAVGHYPQRAESLLDAVVDVYGVEGFFRATGGFPGLLQLLWLGNGLGAHPVFFWPTYVLLVRLDPRPEVLADPMGCWS